MASNFTKIVETRIGTQEMLVSVKYFVGARYTSTMYVNYDSTIKTDLPIMNIEDSEIVSKHMQELILTAKSFVNIEKP